MTTVAEVGRQSNGGVSFQARCLAFIRRLWDLDELRMFHHPVSGSELPDYHQVIKCPIDLTTIRKGIESGAYASDVEVQSDVARMISNALEYNAEGTAWHRQALSFRKVYMDLARQSGMVVESDEAYIPSRAFKDDESTLRKAEKRNKENLDNVLKELEAEKQVPLEDIMEKYRRKEGQTDVHNVIDRDSSGSSSSSSSSSEEEEEDDDDDDDDDEEDESGDSDDDDDDDTS